MLACWPDLAGPSEVLLRKSQVKFRSDQQLLNVIRVSCPPGVPSADRQATHYQPAFLNRQFIMIMEANGVPQSLFIELFDKAIQHLHNLEERAKSRSLTSQDAIWVRCHVVGHSTDDRCRRSPYFH